MPPNIFNITQVTGISPFSFFLKKEGIYYGTFHLVKRRYARYYKGTKGVSPMY